MGCLILSLWRSYSFGNEKVAGLGGRQIIGGGEFKWIGRIIRWILKSPRIMTSMVLEVNRLKRLILQGVEKDPGL